MGFKKGESGFKGKTHSEESKAKTRASVLAKGIKPPVMWGNTNNKGKKFGPRPDSGRKQISASRLTSDKVKAHNKLLSEQRKGENNPAWKGGVSKMPYPFEWTSEFKESIRDKQGRFCHLCWATESEIQLTDSEGKLRKHHDVHHIDAVKDNLDKNNLIVLCHPCHQKITMGAWNMQVI